ncbi:MAG: UPF0149 family protein [Dokdonella sp.]
MSESPISHQVLSDTLARLRAGINASDLHGSLIGYFCAGGKASADSWTDALALDLAEAGDAEDALFAMFYQQCREQLDDADFGFTPMLPNDEAELSVRADALVDWCRGFLGGVGLAGDGSPRGELSDDAREIVQDFGVIAATHFDYAGSEEDEIALAEVIEFVRVGVLLLYSEFAPAPSSPSANAPSSRSVH